MLMCVPCQVTAQFLARMVMPRSRSMSLLSITRSATFSFSRKVPLWRSSWSTSVVLPWSTCAMIAMLRICWVMVVVQASWALYLERAEKSVRNQFAGGDVGGAEKGARVGSVDAHGRRVGQADATAQAGQEAAGLVVGQAHQRPVGQQHVGRLQQRQAGVVVQCRQLRRS
jgi:hypothetical protein